MTTSLSFKGLKFTPWCLDYWVDPSNPDQAVLTIGDVGGQVMSTQNRNWEDELGVMTMHCVFSQVNALFFTSARISLFERQCLLSTDAGSADTVLWDELVRGKHGCCHTVTHQAHKPAWVRKGKKRSRESHNGTGMESMGSTPAVTHFRTE